MILVIFTNKVVCNFRCEVRGPSVLWSGEDQDLQAEKTDEELLLSELREELLPKVASEETRLF